MPTKTEPANQTALLTGQPHPSGATNIRDLDTSISSLPKMTKCQATRDFELEDLNS